MCNNNLQPGIEVAERDVCVYVSVRLCCVCVNSEMSLHWTILTELIKTCNYSRACLTLLLMCVD